MASLTEAVLQIIGFISVWISSLKLAQCVHLPHLNNEESKCDNRIMNPTTVTVVLMMIFLHRRKVK